MKRLGERGGGNFLVLKIIFDNIYNSAQQLLQETFELFIYIYYIYKIFKIYIYFTSKCYFPLFGTCFENFCVCLLYTSMFSTKPDVSAMPSTSIISENRVR